MVVDSLLLFPPPTYEDASTRSYLLVLPLRSSSSLPPFLPACLPVLTLIIQISYQDYRS